MNWNRLAGGFVCAALLAYGCGGGGNGPTPPKAASLVSVAVSGSGSVTLGSTTSLVATASFSDGSSQNVTASSSWNSSTGAASVAGGVVTGVSLGPTSITATFQGMASTGFAVLVSAAPPATATLSSVTVSGASTVAVGSTISLVATARFSDNSTQTVTGGSTWSSSAGNVATVSSTGVVSGASAGSTNITATFQGMASAPFAVQVTTTPAPPPTLSSVTVSGTASVQVGNTTPLVATARFSDNSTQVVTASSTWASSSNGVATVSNAGVVTGVSAGSTSITATFQGVASAAFAVQVTPLPVQAVITVFPTNPAEGNENTCPIVPLPPNNKLDCKFDAVGSQPVGGISSYKWTIPVGTSNVFTITGAALQAPSVGCGNLSGISQGSTREVELTITTSTGATSTVRKSITFTKANPC